MNTDSEITAIADYVMQTELGTNVTWLTAKACLLDSIGCAIAASDNPHCQHLLGPVVPGLHDHEGVPVPGTLYRLDPIRAALNIGLLIRWLDYNDTWLAAEWGHPSDNLGAILAATYNQPGVTLRDVGVALIQAYEIQGVLALENSFNARGFDHVILVKLASTAVVTRLLGGNHQQVCDAVSQALVDGQPLRAYRHAPNTGPRKSWASGDACSRAMQLALWTLAGEPGYPQALTAPRWGFQDVIMGGLPWQRGQDYQHYVMDNILFKVSFPAEFHGQTAVECALALYEKYSSRVKDIDKIEIRTQRAAMDIINKTGVLKHVADRDHALQYMVAVALCYGELRAEHYEDDVAADPLIDKLRDRMTVAEDPEFTRAYYDPQQRAIANAIRLHFSDGQVSDWQEQWYPLGHQRRRESALPLLKEKCMTSIHTRLTPQAAEKIDSWWDEDAAFWATEVKSLMDLLTLVQ